MAKATLKLDSTSTRKLKLKSSTLGRKTLTLSSAGKLSTHIRPAKPSARKIAKRKTARLALSVVVMNADMTTSSYRKRVTLSGK